MKTITAIVSLVLLLGTAANATCLSYENRGSQTYWQNHCSAYVNVIWDDDDYCDGWSCAENAGPNRRSSIITRGSNVAWCECQGTTCYPGTGSRCAGSTSR